MVWTSSNGSAGIDHNYCGANALLGRASYFAEAAAYSHCNGYAYCLPHPELDRRQVFVARVATGRCYDVHSTPWPEDCEWTWRDKDEVPVPLPCFLEQPVAGGDPPSYLRNPPKGFDSVRGDVGGPLMAVTTYAAYRAYPLYLVTYDYAGQQGPGAL